MIRGYTRRGLAYVDATVRVPSLGSGTSRVTFLIDTGATLNVLQPEHAQRLELSVPDAWDDPRVRIARGFGGDIRLIDTVAELTFVDDAVPRPQLLPMAVAEPTAEASGLPAVLGTAALRHFRLHVSLSEGLVELEPLR
jgi:hypothetical protein